MRNKAISRMPQVTSSRLAMLSRCIWVLMLLGSASLAADGPMLVKGISAVRDPGAVTITIECSAVPSISSFYQAEPPAVIVDFVGARCQVQDAGGVAGTPVRGIHAEQWRTAPLITRVVVSLDRSLDYTVDRVGNDVTIRVPLSAPRTAPVENRAFDYAEPEDEGSDELVTMIVKDADVASILQLLAAQFKLNILTTAEVKGIVTFQFNSVPLQTALDVLAKAANCNFYRDGDVLMVKSFKTDVPGELKSRLFSLDYVEAEDVKSTIDKLLSNKGSVVVSYRRVADGGSSKRTSLLLVTDLPEHLNNIERVIRELDQPVPSISIEAKFIETTMSKDDLYGIDWSVGAGMKLGVMPDVNMPRAGDIIQFPLRIGTIALGTISVGNLNAVLQLLGTRGNSRVLANPRVLTLDNHTVTVTSSQQYPLRQVRVDPGTQAQTITWSRQNIPITLKATPHVLADGSIDMEVNPIVEMVSGYVGSGVDQQPITSRREATANIRVRDGEVAVIGGLMMDNSIKTVSKVPFFGHIPILGPLLFTQTHNVVNTSNLLIFIIPHVIAPQ